MLIQALYIKALFKLTFLNSNKNNSMKTYFSAACLKWFFGEKNLHTHTQKWFKLTALRWWSLSDRCSTPAFTDTMMLLLRLRLSSAWDLLSSSFWRWLWNSSSILSPLTKQNKHMQSCTNTCIANRPVRSIDNFQGTIRTLWRSNVWPWEFGMTCVLTFRVWNDLCTDLDSLASPVYFISSNSIWSFSLSSFSRVICFSLSFCSASRCLVVSSWPSNRRTTSCYADNTILKIWSTLQQILV